MAPNFSRVDHLRFAGTKDGRWSQPEVAPFSGQFQDADPYITVDENTSTSSLIAPWRLAANVSRIHANLGHGKDGVRLGARRAISQCRSTAIRIIFIRSP